MIWVRKSIRIEEAALEAGIETKVILEFIQNEWITPSEPTKQELDEEDLARLRFILNLRDEFGVNDESVPIILHLLDQLHCLHNKMSKIDSGE